MHIIVVEDDHHQATPLVERLTDAFGPVTLRTVSTEEAFRDLLPSLRRDVPDVVVMDVMLRWATPRPDMTAPPADVVRDGYYRAGLRCARLLHADDLLSAVPVVLYTILEDDDLRRDGQAWPPNTTYVGKSTELDGLTRHIRSRIRR